MNGIVERPGATFGKDKHTDLHTDGKPRRTVGFVWRPNYTDLWAAAVWNDHTNAYQKVGAYPTRQEAVDTVVARWVGIQLTGAS